MSIIEIVAESFPLKVNVSRLCTTSLPRQGTSFQQLKNKMFGSGGVCESITPPQGKSY